MTGPRSSGSRVQVYGPPQRGLPALAPYVRGLWRHRGLAVELTRSELRAEHLNSILGQLWLLINPLLLAGVYFVLVEIVADGRKDAVYFAELLAALFAFQLVANSVSGGAKSVLNNSRLVLNVQFPRLLLPVSAVLSAFLRLLPALVVYAVLHVVVGRPVVPNILWLVPVLILLTGFSLGVAAFFAVLQVYLRDVKTLLPFFLRLWLYLSPVLYTADQVPPVLQPLTVLNPLFPLLGSWQDALSGQAPPVAALLACAAWAAGSLIVGVGIFLTRERHLAVHI